MCSKRPAEGVAEVLDPENGIMELHLCEPCVRAMVPPEEHSMFGLDK